MKIKVFQIDSDRDKNRVKFENYNSALKYNGKIDPSIYNTVFEGDVECKTLEDVFEMFNRNHPVTHHGNSMSVSDIVQVLESNPNINGIYFCDSIGFKNISDEFNSSITKPIQGIKMLVIEPHKPPYEALIPDDYKALQKAVGGMFQCYYPFKDNSFVICNDEGKICGLEGNRKIGNEIIAGTFLITADDGVEGITGLTDEQVEKYIKQFEADEVYTQDEVEGSISIKIIGFN